MSMSGNAPTRDERPEFMAILGLLPPYSREDVKRAYLAKVRTAHPDHGGEISAFRRIQDAYEAARQYVEFKSDKRSWIAAQVDRYVELSKLEAQLRGHGAEIEYQQIDWLYKSYGDFAELTATVHAIKLQDSPAGNEVARLLVAERTLVGGLKHLEMIRCELTDDAVLPLSCFQLLEHLDLSGNKVTRQSASLAGTIPTLREFRLDDTSVGMWEKMKLARLLKKRAATPPPFSPT
ncbi:MAG: hypothetical protein AAGF97_06340 [Planctomycetota bacterium]